MTRGSTERAVSVFRQIPPGLEDTRYPQAFRASSWSRATAYTSCLHIRQKQQIIWTHHMTTGTRYRRFLRPITRSILSLTNTIRQTAVSTANYFLLCVFALVFIALFVTGGGPLGRKFSSVLWSNPHCLSLFVLRT